MKKKVLTVLFLATLCLLAVCLMACEEEHIHDYGEWTVTKAATCSAQGEETRSCDCGVSETQAIPATGVHTYGPWTQTLAADCGNKGEQMRLCSGCGDVNTGSIFATNEHLYGSDNVCLICNKKWEYSQGLTYELTLGGGAYAVVGNESSIEEVLVLPYYYNGLPVTEIGAGAFRGNSGFHEVVLPDLITAICAEAFSGCSNLTLVTFETNSHLTLIGEKAFANTGISEFTVGSNLIEVGDGAFANCNGLSKFILAEDNIRFSVGGGTDGSCLIDRASKTLISAGLSGVVPANGSVEVIAPYAFSSSSAVRVVIPAGVTEIAPLAFAEYASLSEVDFREMDGWKVSLTADGADAIAVIPDVTALKTTYLNYYWIRTVTAE